MPVDIATFIITIVSAYLIGSIPSGVFVAWLFNLQDPRAIGSGSIGATNVLRLGHKGAAAFTLALDFLKGLVAVLFAAIFIPELIQLCAIFVVVGHIFPVWLGFKGGKGIASAFGALAMLSWPLAAACFITWLVVAFTTRYSSLASLITVFLAPLYSMILTTFNTVMTCFVLALLLIWSHRHNIGRLLTGKETKIGQSRSQAPPRKK